MGRPHRNQYGRTVWSVEEFTAASVRTRWERRKALMIHLMMTMENPTYKNIAAQTGLPASVVGRIFKHPEIKDALTHRISYWLDQGAMEAMAVISESMKDDKPIAIRLNAAKWLMERRDHIYERELKQTAPKLESEDEIEEQMKELGRKRQQRIAAMKTVEATVIEPQGAQCPTSPGSSTSESPPPSSAENGSGATPENGSTSSPPTSSDSANWSNDSPSPN